MGRKSYKVESEIKIDTICVPRSNMCPLDHVYLNLELFGETQRTKLLHPIFPIKSSDKFYFNKTFWSPQNEGELHKLMKESPVSVELRYLQPGSKDSILFAFTDTNAYHFLIEDALSTPKGVLSSERLVYLSQTKHSCGQLPCVKVHIKSKISSSETPVMDKLMDADMNLCPICDHFYLKKSQVFHGGTHVIPKGDMFSCTCELHRGGEKDMFHCHSCHQDYSSSLSRRGSRKSLREKIDESEGNIEDFEEERNEHGPGQMRAPFVVRKVDRDIIGRIPDAYDSIYNCTMREQQELRSSRRKKLHRLRSCSPKRDVKEKRSPSNKNRLKDTEVCYSCSLPSNEMRLSCDACNLTSRGEPPFRGGDLVRPEPPMLRTLRETVDQKPLYPFHEMKCSRCCRRKSGKSLTSRDDQLLLSSTRPIYKLHGYQDMAKYFSCHDPREY